MDIEVPESLIMESNNMKFLLFQQIVELMKLINLKTRPKTFEFKF